MGKLFITLVMAIIAAFFILYAIIKILKNNNSNVKKNLVEEDSDKYLKLKNLAELKEKNIISEDEFNEEKKKILSN